MIDKKLNERFERIERAIGLMDGIIDITPGPSTEKVRASFVGPLVELPEEEEGFNLNELLRKVEEMIENRLGDLQGDVYEIINEYNSNPNNINQTFYNTIIQRGFRVKVFEVQSAATGDGVYNCYEQKLDATEWDDTAGDDKFDDKNSTSVEVLNLLENDPVEGTYVAALAAKDRMACWQWPDDEGTKRWVGRPLTPSVRTVRAKEAAPESSMDSTTITCNLVDNEGGEITSGLGSAIEVWGRCGVSVNWDMVSPIVINDAYMQAEWIAGKWWFVGAFQAILPCICYQIE